LFRDWKPAPAYATFVLSAKPFGVRLPKSDPAMGRARTAASPHRSDVGNAHPEKTIERPFGANGWGVTWRNGGRAKAFTRYPALDCDNRPDTFGVTEPTAQG